MIVIPQIAEQRVFARHIVSLGLGRMIEPRELTPQLLRTTVMEVLESEELKRNVLAAKAALPTIPAAVTACASLEALTRTQPRREVAGAATDAERYLYARHRPVLSLLIWSMLEHSNCHFRLVGNGCSPEEMALLRRLSEQSPRLAFLALPAGRCCHTARRSTTCRLPRMRTGSRFSIPISVRAGHFRPGSSS